MGDISRALRQLRPFQPPPISSPSPPLLRPPLLRQRPLSHTMAQPTLFSLPRCGIATYRQFFHLCSPSLTSTRTLLTSHTQTLPRYQCQRQRQRQQQQQRIPSQSLSKNRQRKYHSHHHLKDPHEYTNSQTTILSAALAHVPRHGFTHEALTLGARDAGFLDVSVQLLPRGEFDLVLFWLASRRGLLRDVAAEKFTEGISMSSEEKVKMLVLERLWMNKGIRGKWQGALALMSLAGNIPISLSELHALASDILSLAGDTSVDVSWYTKRMSVAAVYASADVFMTHDESPNFAETEAFVQRRLEDTSAIGEKLGSMRQCLGFMGSTAIGLGRSWGLKI